MLEDIYSVPRSITQFIQTLYSASVSAIDRQSCLPCSHHTQQSINLRQLYTRAAVINSFLIKGCI